MDDDDDDDVSDYIYQEKTIYGGMGSTVVFWGKLGEFDS